MSPEEAKKWARPEWYELWADGYGVPHIFVLVFRPTAASPYQVHDIRTPGDPFATFATYEAATAWLAKGGVEYSRVEGRTHTPEDTHFAA
jgi:hypothetical protein